MNQEFNLTTYQNELKKILSRVDEILTQFSIPYTIAYGTLLGAVRHGDIIPWDDDIDIYIMRQDFERACDIIRRECPVFYVWDWNHDVKCDLPFARVFNRVISGQSLESYLAYIDVYVMDYAPDSKLFQKLTPLLWVALWRLVNLKSGHKIFWNPYSLKSIVFYIVMLPFSIFSIKKLKTMYAKFKGRLFTVGKYVWYDKMVFKAEWFATPKRMKFGDMSVLAPNRYEDILVACYGDWRTPPKDAKDRGQHAYTNDGVEIATRPDDRERS